MSGHDPRHLRLLEAILFASAEALGERELAARLPDGAEVAELLAELEEHYSGRGVTLVRAGKSWAFRTAPDLASQLTAAAETARKLGRAAVETLAIIAYHQPVTRGEIEEIRGVGMNRGALDVLFEAGWIRPKGRRRTPGRPVTWGTTDAFLDHFGLETLADLPGVDDLKAAGLLDARPAIETFRVGGEPAPAEAGEEPAEAAEEDPAPTSPLTAGEG